MKLLIVAGEASGDLHGGALARSIQTIAPDTRLFGIGGESMRDAGVDIRIDARDLAVTGFTEVTGRIFTIWKAMRWAVDACRREKPDAAVLIDYPDFNLRLAKRLHRLGVRIAYYVSPQLWAWRPGRVKTVSECVDRMIVLFPFEKGWYQQRGVDARYVGNPVVDRMRHFPNHMESRRRLDIGEDRFLIALMPGSRQNEIKRILPVFARAAVRIRNEFPVDFILPVAPSIHQSYLQRFLDASGVSIRLSSEPSPVALKAADFAWVTSGTATLETALAGTPMIVVYKTSTISYLLARMLVKVDHIGMVNLVAGEEVAPELIQGRVTPRNLVMLTRPVLENRASLEPLWRNLAAVNRAMGEGGASDRAAEEVIDLCSSDG